jgi:hypothetical protein
VPLKVDSAVCSAAVVLHHRELMVMDPFAGTTMLRPFKLLAV